MRLGKTLQLYLLKNFWAALLSVIFIFIFLVFFANLLSNLDEFIAAKLPFKQFVNYYLYTIPMVFIICLPISVLLSVMRIFRNLSLSNEYVALITSGISLNVMIFPLAVSCILLSYISFFVSDKIAPVTNYKRKIMINEKFKSFKVIKNKNIMGKKGKQYYLNEYQIENKIIKGLMISEANEKDKVTLRTFAETAAWTGDQWKCQGVKIQPYNDNGLPIKPENYTEYFLKDIIKPDEILISKDESNYLDTRGLRRLIRSLPLSQEKMRVQLQVEYYRKYSISFLPIILLFVAIPFSIAPIRSDSTKTIGFGIVLCFVYYIIDALFCQMGRGMILDPILAAWATNILFGIFSIFTLRNAPH